jgi:hypothetical protein
MTKNNSTLSILFTILALATATGFAAEATDDGETTASEQVAAPSARTVQAPETREEPSRADDGVPELMGSPLPFVPSPKGIRIASAHEELPTPPHPCPELELEGAR